MVVVKASFTLTKSTSLIIEGKMCLDVPNGTSITLEGTPDELQKLLANPDASDITVSSSKAKSNGKYKSSTKPDISSNAPPQIIADILNIVNLAKSCPDAEAIEQNILENKPSETDRVLLPLYIVHEYLNNAYGLTTVEIAEVMSELGSAAKITRQNALRALTKRQAAKYVTADKMRKPGSGTRYTLNDRGVQYLKSIFQKTVTE
jgi:hypothetical protein